MYAQTTATMKHNGIHVAVLTDIQAYWCMTLC